MQPLDSSDATGNVAPFVPAREKNVAPKTIYPGSTIGMLGGGQLGRMFGVAATLMGYRLLVLEGVSDCPASAVASKTLTGPYNSHELLTEFAKECDVVTLEFENIPADSVDYITRYTNVYPQASVLRIAQDRGIEKQTLFNAGLPVTPFRLVNSALDLQKAADELGLPLVIKTTRDGYDGKGQWKIESPDSLLRWSGGESATGTNPFSKPLIAEAWIEYQKEISVIIARGTVGNDTTASESTAVQSFPCKAFPVFENNHRNHILDVTRCPAEIPQSLANDAIAIAMKAVESLGLFGLICIEFFIDPHGRLMINEIAPRPHNSGHLTIEACQTSQFEQQLRAICGLPLGDASLIVSSAAMVNIMGEDWNFGTPDWTAILKIPGCHLHLYGKKEAKKGRKMGHVTVTGDPDTVRERIQSVQKILRRNP